ncbi:MAG: regulatory protein RecX [Clostridia bacterium]|nr:regulatory protein RecX [Clostridia bacterium]
MIISVNTGKQNKIHILCDGEYSFTVDAEYWYSSPYCSLKEIVDDEELAAFYEAVGSRCAFLAGLRLLSYHDQSEREMFNKLVQKGHKREYAFVACEKLKEYGYINDQRYAENLAEKLIRTKGMSVKGIKYELLGKGISREIADNVAESLDFDPILRIIELLNTKYARYLSDEKGIRKTVASLQRLGYNWSDIKSALRSVETETEDFDDV